MKCKLLFALIFMSSFTFAGDYSISGKIIQVLDDGENIPLKGEIINLKAKHLIDGYASVMIEEFRGKETGEDGDFNLPIQTEEIDPGQEVDLFIDNSEFFILSPLAGKMYLPNKPIKEKIIFVASKKSRFYHAFMQGISGYSVQVLLTSNEGNAVDTVKLLRRDGHNAYYESNVKNGIPNSGYFYKVRIKVDLKGEGIDSYKAMQQVIKFKKEIKRRYKGVFDDSFIVVHTGDREEVL